MMLTVCPTAIAAPEDEDPADDIMEYPIMPTDEEDFDDPADVEEYYEGDGTVYDLKDESNAEPLPEEAPPPEVIDPDEESEEEIYGDDLFYGETAKQLDGGEHILDEINIIFYPRSDFPGKEKQYDDAVAKVLKDGLSYIGESIDGEPMYNVRSEDFLKNPNATLNKFKNNKYIKVVEPNYICVTEAAPNDPNYTSQKLTLTAINAINGWDIIRGGGPVVAVVDSGVVQHPDLPPLLPGYSSVSGLSPNNDTVGHGTGVAGTIGAVGDNNLGGVGINWNANILPVKVDDASGTMSTANVAKGIIWAADNGAKIINLSLGSSSSSVTMENAINYAYTKGCAIFAATGNDGKNGISYPARYANVVAVGGTSAGSTRAAVSNYGTGMGVMAITSYSTLTPSGGFSTLSGTSFSCPQAVGLASLVWALNPSLTNDQVVDLIYRGAKGGGSYVNDEIGYGCINIANTLTLTQATLASAPAVPVDKTAPVLTMTGSQTMTISQGTAYTEPGYKAVDDVDGDITSKVTVTGTVNVNTPGTYTLTYTVSDAAGNKNTATRTITVTAVDKTAPVITLTGGASVQINQGTAYTEPGYTATDNIDGNITSKVTVTGTVNVNTAGTYTLTYTVSDAAGNAATATRTITVAAVDKTAPVITLTGGTSVQINQGTAYTEPGYTATDNVDGNITSKVTVTGTVNANTAGTYTLTYKVSDTAGNTATATRTVSVVYVDKTSPTLTLAGDNPAQINQGTEYTEPGYTATDNVDGNITSKVTVTGTVNTGVPGIYTITYTVKDTAGNTATTARKITVNAVPETPPEPPRTPPTIALTGFASMTLEYGQAYIEDGYRAADCDGKDITANVKITGTVDHWNAGLYTITYEVSDTVNPNLTARAARTVTVSPKPADPPPKEAPKITIIGSGTIILHQDSATAYKEQKAKAVDYDGKDISDLVTVSGNLNRTTAGTYTINYSVTSPDSKLTSTASRTVRIVAPTEKSEARKSYGLSGQAKQGAKVTHTGVLASSVGFMDLKIASIDKNMTITTKLIDTATKKSVLTDTFSAAGTKQYKIDEGKYELEVTIDKANGNSKYELNLTMPEAAPVMIYEINEVPLISPPQIAPIGSNPIVLYASSPTPYREQGAKAVDFLGNDMSGSVTCTPFTDAQRGTPGTYTITYTVMWGNVPIEVTRDVRILDEFEELGEAEVPEPVWDDAWTAILEANEQQNGGGEIIDDEDTPLATIRDSNVPLAVFPNPPTGDPALDEVMAEDEVPLGVFPNPPTGDMSAILIALMLTAAGIVTVYRSKKGKVR